MFTDDWAADAAAWAALGGEDIAQLLARQKAGAVVRLTLCGDSHAQTFASSRPGWVQRMANLFGPQPVQSLLDQL